MITPEPFIVHCGVCSAEWSIGTIPLTVRELHHKALVGCPSCGTSSKNVFCHPKPVANRLPV